MLRSTSYAWLILPFLVLVCAFLIRLDVVMYPHYWYQSDYNRDYLIASHIISYQEFPSRGPDGGLGILSSPFYYYFLAFWLLISNNMIFLGIVNVFWQLAGLIIASFLSYKMFGKRAGILALMLFSFTQGFIVQSAFVWQPYVMHSFIIASYLFLFLSYETKKYSFVLSSIAFFVLALMTHYSVAVVIPVYFLLVCFVLAKHKNFWKKYITAILIFVVSIFLLSGYMHGVFKDGSGGDLVHVWDMLGVTEFTFSRFWERLGLFLQYFSIKNNLSGYSYGLLIVALSVSSFFSRTRSTRAKILTGALWAVIFQSLVIIALKSDLPYNIPFPVRYFAPLFPLFLIGIISAGEFLISLMPTKIGKNLAVIVFSAVSLIVFSPGLPSHKLGNTAFISHLPPDNLLFYNTTIQNNGRWWKLQYLLSDKVKAVKNVLIEIKELEGRDNVPLFDVATYRIVDGGYILNEYEREAYIVPLEQIFEEQFAILDDTELRGWRARGSEYIIIECPIGSKNVVVEQCTDVFKKQYIEHSYILPMGEFEGKILYLAARSSKK